jgi:putative transposase
VFLFVNARARWNGHLFQDRYASVAMDEAHLIAAVRYVSLNPVRAGVVSRAEDWAWSSVRAHLNGDDDGLVRGRPVLDRVERFDELIADGAEAGITGTLSPCAFGCSILGSRDCCDRP